MIENCRHCGKEIEGEGVFCPECRAIAGAKKPKRIWIFSLIFSGLLLSLTGMMFWHGGLSFGNLSLDAIWGKPAAVINGEKISRSDLKARLKIFQRILERQYGNDLFTGDRGRALFVNLKNKVLNDMLEEKLVSQEARKLGKQVTDEQVKQKMDQITKEIFGTWENFQTRLQEEGMSKEDLQKNIRYLLLLEALKEAKAPEGGNPDGSFNAWLIQARQKAEVTVYNSENLPGSAPSLAGGCCSLTGSSGGCRGQSALLADEPTGNLDTKTSDEIMHLLQGLNSDGMTIIMVTHNFECAQYAGKILRLSDGLLVEEERVMREGVVYNPSKVRREDLYFNQSF